MLPPIDGRMLATAVHDVQLADSARYTAPSAKTITESSTWRSREKRNPLSDRMIKLGSTCRLPRYGAASAHSIKDHVHLIVNTRVVSFEHFCSALEFWCA